jgi:hypothetical protein
MHSMMSSRRQGIVIVSILVLTLLATFFLGALVQMNPSRLRRNLHDENRDRAAMAARAGVDYALNRFKSDTDWVANANTETVLMDDLVIREDNGNVLGWIRAEDGTWAAFRMRFNAQDGPLGRDGIDDPVYSMSTRSVSLNNLSGPDAQPVPLANTSFEAPVGALDVSMTAPPNSIALVVEGIVGPELSPSDPEGLAQATGVTTRTVEGIYVVSDITTGTDGDAVLMAGGDALVQVGDRPTGSEPESNRDIRGVLSLQSSSDNIAGIRSKGKLELSRGQGGGSSSKFDPDADATVQVNPQTPFNEVLADGSTFEGSEEDLDATFHKIEWDKVKDSEQAGAVTLPGGVYIFTDGGADSGRSLSQNVKYYDMTWDQYRNKLMSGTVPVESPVPPDFLDMVELDAKSVTLTKIENGNEVEYQEKRDVIRLTGDVTVNDPDSKGLTIVPERGARQKAGSDGEAAGEPIDSGDFAGLPDQARIESSSGIMEEMAALLMIGGGATGQFTFNTGTQSEIIVYQPSLPYGGFDFYTNGSPGPGATMVGQVALGGGTFDISASNYATTQAVLDGVTYTPQGVVANVASSYSVQVTDPVAFLASLGISPPPPELLSSGGSGAVDPLHIPKVDPQTGRVISDDETVPQDIELVFDPAEGNDSAFIRSDSDIFLGTHLSGEGGGVISNKEVNLVGFGVNIHARANQNIDEVQERTGVAIYGKDGINVSTYDERRNKYWDIEIKGAVFTEGNIFMRLGEDALTSGETPTWGTLDYEGSMIALGHETASASLGAGIQPGPGTVENPNSSTESGGTGGTGLTNGPRSQEVGTVTATTTTGGRAEMIARGVRLFYDPRYLAPYVEDTRINPTFTALSVSER